MPLSFRQRIFLVLAAVTAVPTLLAVIGWALAARVNAPAAGARASLEEVAGSTRRMLQHVDTTALDASGRAAVRAHLDLVSNSLSLARRAETYFRYYAGGFLAVIVLLGAVMLFAAVRLAGHLSRQLSRPIDGLVGWTRLIRRRLPLPEGPPPRGAPEFEALRQALRDLASAIETARVRELEAERLKAFREVARRVAHEIKNPLTAMRIAVDQLGRGGGPADQRTEVAIEVLGAETERLERMAREFADFGRLAEGPRSEVDVVELLLELGQTAVPDGVKVNVQTQGARRSLLGYYDPLRRAFSNLLRNASEAMHGQGAIDITVTGNGTSGEISAHPLIVTISDHGQGIPSDLRQRVFEPYFTTKTDGTGLGLALVRQTLEAHGGSIDAGETPGGGATFTLTFPA